MSPFAVCYADEVAARDVLARAGGVLGVVGYGAGRPEFLTRTCPFVAAPLSPAAGGPMFEIWTMVSPCRPFQVGAVKGACGDDVAFGAVTLAEAGGASLEDVVEAAYLGIFNENTPHGSVPVDKIAQSARILWFWPGQNVICHGEFPWLGDDDLAGVEPDLQDGHGAAGDGVLHGTPLLVVGKSRTKPGRLSNELTGQPVSAPPAGQGRPRMTRGRIKTHIELFHETIGRNSLIASRRNDLGEEK